MKERKKRLITVLFLVALTAGILLYAMFEHAPVEKGTMASGIDWTVDSEGVLVITSDEGMKEWCDSGYKQAFKDNVIKIVLEDGVTSIESFAFLYCSSLEEIIIPDSVTKIGFDAFSHCFALKEVIVPDGVKNIVHGTFYCCSALQKVTIPDTVTSIDDSAFAGCSSLTEITIPDSVKSIDNQAFYYCTALTNVTVPPSVTKMGHFVFGNCENLMEVTLNAKIPQSYSDDIFENAGSLKKINVPVGTVESYRDFFKEQAAYIVEQPQTGEDEAKTGGHIPLGWYVILAILAIFVAWGYIKYIMIKRQLQSKNKQMEHKKTDETIL